jgi:uncharacterized protein (DUF1330 family)
MVKLLQSSLLKIAMAVMAILPVSLCLTAETISAEETAQAYSVTPKANSRGVVKSIKPIVVTFDNATTVVPNTSIPNLKYGYIEYNEGEDGWVEILSGETITGNAISYYLVDDGVKEGEYRLIIPANTYYIDGVANQEIIHYFTYEAPAPVIITPAEGEVESLQTFVLEFQGVDSLAATFSREAYPVLYNVTGDHNEFSWTSATVEGNKMTLKTNAPIYYVGAYQLRIPGAAYSVDGVQGEDLVFDYDIVASAKTIEYTVTPVAGKDGKVSTIIPITITFPNALSVVDNPKADYYTQYAYVEYNSARAGWGEIPAEINTQSNSIIAFIEESDRNSGEFRITIPAGTYLVDGVESPEIVETFDYLLPLSDFVTIDPAEGEVESLQTFVLTFPKNSLVAANISASAAPALANSENTLFSWDDSNVATYSVEGNKLTLTTKAEVAIAGKYELTIPGAAYTTDGVEGRDLTFAYTIVTSAKTVEYIISPVADEDGFVEAVSPITVTFPNATAVADNPNADYYSQYAYVEYNSARAGWGEIPVTVQLQGHDILLYLEESDQIPGEFKLTIPAGTYLVDGVENTEIVATFNVDYPYASITPKEGEVASLEDFTIEFPKADKLDYTITSDAYATLVDVSEDPEVLVATIKAAKVEGNKVYFKLAELLKAAGEYELRVPGAAYTLDGVQGQDLVFKYSIAAAANALEYTITPADGDSITALDKVVIEFPNASKVALDDSNWELYPAIEVYNEAWEDWDDLSAEAEVEGNQIILTIPSWVTLTNGDYRVSVPAGIVTVDHIALEEAISSKFNLQIPVPEFTTTIDPEEGVVSSLGEFNITFNGVEVALNNYTSDTKYYIESEAGIKIYSTEAFINYDAEGAPLYIAFNNITTEGEYELVLPANSYKVDGVLGNELRFKYTVGTTTAISSIFTDGVESVDVYDLRGVRVLSNAKAEDLRNLNTNVYIINGQKYLIRK